MTLEGRLKLSMNLSILPLQFDYQVELTMDAQALPSKENGS